LKQTTSKGESAWDVYEGKMIIFNPNFCAYSIAFKVTWDPCPSKMNRCLLVWGIPPNINLLGEKKFLERKVVIHAFDYITIQVFGSKIVSSHGVSYFL
jgi:hypothetical protein